MDLKLSVFCVSHFLIVQHVGENLKFSLCGPKCSLYGPLRRNTGDIALLSLKPTNIFKIVKRVFENGRLCHQSKTLIE